MAVTSRIVPAHVPNREAIALVNLLLRKEPTKLTIIQLGQIDPNPELFVVTRVDWRKANLPLLAQLPTILSYLDTMRGTKGVPERIHLEGGDGVELFIPTKVRASQIPSGPREAYEFLSRLVKDTVLFIHRTASEVEETFWSIARKRGFSPEIVAKIEESAPGFSLPEYRYRFSKILETYFSTRFTIHTAEAVLHVEE